MKNVAVGLLGTKLDNRGKSEKRWRKWRPTVSLCGHTELPVERFELLHETRDRNLAEKIVQDIQQISPETEVCLHPIRVRDPWDFQEMYGALLDFCLDYSFKPEHEQYLLHITTGTHVAQICWFLLCEAHYVPGKLLQTSPPNSETQGEGLGSYQIIDLDLSKYDRLASRFERQVEDNLSFLKSGIATRNEAFNRMIDQMEHVAYRSDAPVLITGPTGAGKSQLAKRLYELKRHRGLVKGDFVPVNCATLRGDSAMSSLFGHVRGAFTGAQTKRDGLLSKANTGVLFLDEIGELGADEQAMLLHAIEEHRFYPVGSDATVSSRFQLIAGTNRDLQQDVVDGRFREDLLARINMWTYRLPGLAERKEDLEPNIDYELLLLQKQQGHQVAFNQVARKKYLAFASSDQALWTGNFRDLNASIQRMATLATGGRITEEDVREELATLLQRWEPHSDPQTRKSPGFKVDLTCYFSDEELEEIDLFDQMQLSHVIAICVESSNLSEAGRRLFDKSRLRKSSSNDGHRLRQYLGKFGLTLEKLKELRNAN